MNKYTQHIVFLTLLFLSNDGFAQKVERDQVMKFITTSGSEFVGLIVAQNDSIFTINSETLGELTLLRSQITSIIKYKKTAPNYLATDSTGNYLWKNKMANRNFYTETAFGVEEGRWQYQNLMLFGHLFSYGISKNFTLTMGTEALSLFAGESPVLLIQPKFVFSESTESLCFGIGTNILIVPGTHRGGLGGSLFGLATIGNTNNNLTFGAGFSYSDEGLASHPLLQLGGTVRLSNSVGLTGDFLLGFSRFNANDHFGTITIRLYNPKVNVDVGLVTESFEYFFPALGLTMLFGS